MALGYKEWSLSRPSYSYSQLLKKANGLTKKEYDNGPEEHLCCRGRYHDVCLFGDWVSRSDPLLDDLLVVTMLLLILITVVVGSDVGGIVAVSTLLLLLFFHVAS